LDGQSEHNINRNLMFIIEDRRSGPVDGAGQPVGYLQHPNFPGAQGLTALWYELKPGVSWLDVTPCVVRHLWDKGRKYAEREGKTCSSFCLFLGAQHPAYEALGRNLPSIIEPYAWYMRVPDLPGFLNHIRPALEKRLAESIAVGHSREIKISFYRDGLRLVIEKGKITTIESWKPSPEDGGMIAFPGLTFLQVLFGYRSYDELRRSFPDCWGDEEDVHALINILFPKKLSDLFPVS
jgi:hypothetical protein